MLNVSGLSKSYGEHVIFDNVDFVLGRSERVGLVGRNGHGKTTLFRLILKEEAPDSGSITMPRHYRAGHLSQHLRFSEPTVLGEACLGLKKKDDGTDETYKAATILTGLGIPEEMFEKSPLDLSGGYQVRLNLAKVLASEPELLLLDEPTNYLDIVSIRWLKGFLRAWKGEMMIITHDREFMDSVTTHTMAIHRGKVKKIQGPTEKLYSQIEQEEEIHEQTRLNEEKRVREAMRFITRFRAQATKASAVQSRIKALEKREKLDELVEIRDLDFSFNSAPFEGKWLLEAKDVSFGYGGAPLFEGLSFAVGKKDRIGIIGKNGKGKTTLLNVLAGEISPLRGSVAGHPNLKLAYFGQTNIDRLYRGNTVEEELILAHPDKSRAGARRACGAMMFEGDKALKKIEVLSGGERSRVLLGKLLLSPANMLLLDEPTNHLDMYSVDSLVEAVRGFSGAVIMVTHSEMVLKALANRLIVFDGGSASFFEGGYQDFLDRVGWSNECAPSKAPKQQQGRNINRKELRRMRAEILAERQKALGPLQKKIKAVEEEITGLEGDVERLDHELAIASEGSDSAALIELSKAHSAAKDRIELLFNGLEKLGDELTKKSAEFEKRLGDGAGEPEGAF